MTVSITLTIAGADTGPFDLYSNLDGYVVPFAIDVPKATLVTGYSSNVVPDGTETIRVKSKGNCSNYVDISCRVISYMVSLTKGDSCTEACNEFGFARREFFNLS